MAGTLGLAVAAAVAPHAQAGVWRFHDEHVLGTRLAMVVVAEDEAAALAAGRAARAEIDRLEGVLNGRRPGAELADFNATDGGAVSEDLFEVIRQAEAWRERTRGAYDGRLGAVEALWRDATDAAPGDAALAAALPAPLHLDAATRTVRKPVKLRLALDGLAKGYIVDCALAAARTAAPGLSGVAVDIGGDLACWGTPPDGGLWPVGVSDPLWEGDDAPAVATARITNAAVATSGRGPRDRIIGDRRYSHTLSPVTGRPVDGTLAATVVAACAADADALASAFMVMAPEKALAMADDLPGVATRLTLPDGRVQASRRWETIATEARPARLAAAPVKPTPRPTVPGAAPALRWPPDWGIEMVYVAPDKQEVRNPDFRTPYMALWISDLQNRPVRTVIMVGKEADWHKDNFIWWGSYKTAAARMVDLRSERTALDGRYSLFWRGVNDAWEALPVGDYILHIETSQERGKHSHRTLPLKIGREPFSVVLPATPEGGGLNITYGLKR